MCQVQDDKCVLDLTSSTEEGTKFFYYNGECMDVVVIVIVDLQVRNHTLIVKD